MDTTWTSRRLWPFQSNVLFKFLKVMVADMRPRHGCEPWIDKTPELLDGLEQSQAILDRRLAQRDLIYGQS